MKPGKGSCSFFTSKIYQSKIKCEDEGLYFYENQKYRRLETEKKTSDQLFHFRNSLFFLYGIFQKMLNVSLEHSFKQLL